MTIKWVASGAVFSPLELDLIQSLRAFYTAMKWIDGSIIEPRVVIFEGVHPSALELILGDLGNVISSAYESTESP
jgi:hypothetical protein